MERYQITPRDGVPVSRDVPDILKAQFHGNLIVHDLDLPPMVKEPQDIKDFPRLAYFGTTLGTSL